MLKPTSLTSICTARLVLNYKGIDYETEWMEYANIANKLKEV